MKDVILSVKNLSVEYSSKRRILKAVNDVSFDLNRGETLCLVGETGAGKTTIAKSILGILPELQAKVTGGEIFFNGINLLNATENEMLGIRGNLISMIFQDSMTSLNPVMTIGKQIEECIFLHNKKMEKQEIRRRSVEILREVEISEERYNEYPHQFSGGMKQRVVIAMALVCHPELLLADEPTTALDVTIQAQVLDLINHLKRTINTSMILITHDLGVVAQVCDKVAVVYAGEIIEYGDKEDIFDHPLHPYTLGLFGALPNLDVRVHRLNPVQGLPPDPCALPEGCCFNPRCSMAQSRCAIDKTELIPISETHFVRCPYCRKKGE